VKVFAQPTTSDEWECSNGTNSIVHYTAAQITVVVTLWLNASTISWGCYRK